jgi:hypothetical protein
MPSVFIDGVEYIPAKQAIANEEAIRRGLIMQFWGSCSDIEQLNRICSVVRVIVTDSREYGATIDEVIADIARVAEEDF